MKKHKSRCSCCHEYVFDLSKRFNPVLGFLCVECHDFLGYARKALRKHGIEGSALAPARFTPKPETP